MSELKPGRDIDALERIAGRPCGSPIECNDKMIWLCEPCLARKALTGYLSQELDDDGDDRPKPNYNEDEHDR